MGAPHRALVFFIFQMIIEASLKIVLTQQPWHKPENSCFCHMAIKTCLANQLQITQAYWILMETFPENMG